MKKSIFFATIFFLIQHFSANAIIYNKNPEQKAQVLTKMEEFCKNANGTLTQFENTCANSCILYDRKTGAKITETQTQCEKKQIYSCQCLTNQCLKGNKCEDIIIK